MATIVDYSSLSQALQDWMARSDLVGYTDYFIQLAENKIYRDVLAMNDGRGVRQMEAPLSGTISGNALAIPADYLALKAARVVIDGKQFPLERRNSEFLYTNYPTQSAQSAPSCIARDQSNFIFGPYPDSAYSIVGTYWQKAAALSSTNTTTWMITFCPDVLLAACMTAFSKFIMDDGEMQKWGAFYQDGINGLITADKTEEWSGSGLSIKAL